MKSPHPDAKKLFTQACIEITKEFDCYGKIEGHPSLTKEKSNLELDQILWIQVMMGDLEGLRLTLDLGANPNYRYKGTHILELALAFGDLYGKDIVALLESYGSKLSTKKIHSKKSG